MFAYCGNNPVMRIDPNGTSFTSFCNKIKAGFKSVVNWLNKYALNDDGTYSLYDNDRFRDENAWHEQIFSVSASLPNLDFEEGVFNLGQFSGDVYTGGWEWKYADISLMDFGHAEISAKIDNDELHVGAFISAWSPSFSVNLFGRDFDIGFEVGSLGLSTKIGNKTGHFKAGGGLLGISISWK